MAPGVDGLAGAYAGIRIQWGFPGALARRVTGVVVVAIGARCL